MKKETQQPKAQQHELRHITGRYDDSYEENQDQNVIIINLEPEPILETN